MGMSRRAAKYGVKVAVIEEDGRLGGTCVNVGCVPKKLMWHAADVRGAVEHADEYGHRGTKVQPFDWNYFAEKRDAYVRRLNGIYDNNLKKDGVDYISGHASLVGNNEVEVAFRDEQGKFGGHKQRITADKICIATGGRPMIPSEEECPGANLGITSDGFFELREQPKRVCVVGAGYISVELAGVFNGLGTETHLLCRHDSFLRAFDPIISDTLQEHMTRTGLQVHKKTQITRVEGEKGGPLTLHLNTGGTLEVDCLMWGIGRRPNTDGLGLDAAGVNVDDKGNIVVNEFQETNVDSIYALGDVCGKALLTPVAIAAGRRLSNRLYGPEGLRGKDFLSYENIPTVVFSHPTSGTVGLTEQEAKDKHGEENVKVYNSKFTAMYFGMLEHKEPSAYKLVCAGPEEKVVGLHIVGEYSGVPWAAGQLFFCTDARRRATRARSTSFCQQVWVPTRCYRASQSPSRWVLQRRTSTIPLLYTQRRAKSSSSTDPTAGLPVELALYGVSLARHSIADLTGSQVEPRLLASGLISQVYNVSVIHLRVDEDVSGTALSRKPSTLISLGVWAADWPVPLLSQRRCWNPDRAE